MHALPGTEEIFSAEDRNVAIKKEKRNNEREMSKIAKQAEHNGKET